MNEGREGRPVGKGEGRDGRRNEKRRGGRKGGNTEGDWMRKETDRGEGDRGKEEGNIWGMRDQVRKGRGRKDGARDRKEDED